MTTPYQINQECRALPGMVVLGLVLSLSPTVMSQDHGDSSDERFRKAVKAQNIQNQADQVKQNRLSSSFAAKRLEMQIQDEHVFRQMEIDFRERHRSLKGEQTRQEHELRAELKDDEAKLSEALENLRAVMTVKEAYSQWKFDRRREAFSRKLQSDVAEQLAKAEGERERQKQIAIAAMAYFTGGTSLAAMGPAMSAGGNSKPTTQPANVAPSGAVSPVAESPTGAVKAQRPTPSASGTSAAKRPTSAKINVISDMAKSGVKVYDTPAGPPTRPPINDPGVYADWLDPISFLIGEGVNVARGVGGLFKGGSKPPPTLPPVPKRIYSARELGRSAEDTGAYHNFPALLEKYVFEGTRRVVSDEYVLYTRPGTLNGSPGVFEMGVKPSPSGGVEVIKHRFFRPDGPPPLP